MNIRLSIILFCAIFASMLKAMEHEVEVLQNALENQEDESTLLYEKPATSNHSVITNVLKGAYCIGTGAVSGLGGYGAVKFIESQTSLQEGRGALVLGTTIGLSICFVGASLYLCIKSIFRERKFEKNTELRV